MHSNDSLNNSLSTTFMSRDSTDSINSRFSFKIKNEGFLGENKKPDIKKIYEPDEDNLLMIQIKNALSKMKIEYKKSIETGNNMKYHNNLCDYYFGTFNINSNYSSSINNNDKQNNININKIDY